MWPNLALHASDKHSTPDLTEMDSEAIKKAYLDQTEEWTTLPVEKRADLILENPLIRQEILNDSDSSIKLLIRALFSNYSSQPGLTLFLLRLIQYSDEEVTKLLLKICVEHAKLPSQPSHYFLRLLFSRITRDQIIQIHDQDTPDKASSEKYINALLSLYDQLNSFGLIALTDKEFNTILNFAYYPVKNYPSAPFPFFSEKLSPIFKRRCNEKEMLTDDGCFQPDVIEHAKSSGAIALALVYTNDRWNEILKKRPHDMLTLMYEHGFVTDKILSQKRGSLECYFDNDSFLEPLYNILQRHAKNYPNIIKSFYLKLHELWRKLSLTQRTILLNSHPDIMVDILEKTTKTPKEDIDKSVERELLRGTLSPTLLHITEDIPFIVTELMQRQPDHPKIPEILLNILKSDALFDRFMRATHLLITPHIPQESIIELKDRKLAKVKEDDLDAQTAIERRFAYIEWMRHEHFTDDEKSLLFAIAQNHLWPYLTEVQDPLVNIESDDEDSLTDDEDDEDYEGFYLNEEAINLALANETIALALLQHDVVHELISSIDLKKLAYRHPGIAYICIAKIERAKFGYDKIISRISEESPATICVDLLLHHAEELEQFILEFYQDLNFNGKYRLNHEIRLDFSEKMRLIVNSPIILQHLIDNSDQLEKELSKDPIMFMTELLKEEHSQNKLVQDLIQKIESSPTLSATFDQPLGSLLTETAHKLQNVKEVLERSSPLWKSSGTVLPDSSPQESPKPKQ